MCRSILIIDDDPSSRLLLQEFLVESGYKVTSVDDCSAARAIIRTSCFDVAIVDMNLPDGDGLTLIAELRHTAQNLPALILSGSEYEDVMSASQRSGVEIQGCITKPFSLADILTRMTEIVSQVEA